ncbi:MAG TPA: prolipoprotein diacylglyceryl transferase [Frankiaceae bacterium]|jgi:prolipoprotein diacylglyceryl transferase|nr:prolipoprotein diacylglyceryl transferase [Frankiaceae bacterium]
MIITASIPSPSEGVVHLGPVPLRGYALCIAVGVIVGVLLAERRMRARGAPPGAAADIATVAVPFGIIGARLYHIITTPDPYFGKGGHPIEALYIWRGGLGIWGAIAGGFLGAWLVLRHRGIPTSIAADAFAPALPVAQAFGRWGNWFNQELYGRPSGLPWALHIDPSHRLAGYENVATYQPTFLYESLWCLGVAMLCLWADRRYRLGGGRVFALYVAAYTAGRGWIESLRIDTAHRFFGLRLNDYVSIIVFLLAVAFLIKRRGARDVPFEATGRERVSLTKAADTANEATITPSVASVAEPAAAEGEEPGDSKATAESEPAVRDS